MKRGDLISVVSESTRFMDFCATRMFLLERGAFGLVLKERNTYCEVVFGEGKVLMIPRGESTVEVVEST